MSTWTKVRDAVEAFFNGPIWHFIKPFALSLEEDEANVVITAAKNAITVGAETPGSGETKMAAALVSFSAEVIAEGLPYVESKARTAIELALQGSKAAAPAPAVTTPTPSAA